jgi:RNA polymerase sigma-70 factor (ECF subfamily)
MVSGQHSDEQRLIALMIGYQRGSMDDFSALYAALEQPLRRYLWTFVRDSTTAEDLLQETFLQVHRARHTYTPPRPVRPWIYAITRHVALMYLRSSRRRREVLPADELPEMPVVPEMESYGDRAAVHRLLSQLPRESQEVVVLHHLLGLSFKEVGRIVGTTAGTAKVRAHRALRSIRSRIQEEARLREEGAGS